MSDTVPLKDIQKANKEAVMLTTSDNPYNPFTQFQEWYSFDMQKGYNTCGFLARIAEPADELSQEDDEASVVRAIDEILKYDHRNIYLKVSRSYFETVKAI